MSALFMCCINNLKAQNDYQSVMKVYLRYYEYAELISEVLEKCISIGRKTSWFRRMQTKARFSIETYFTNLCIAFSLYCFHVLLARCRLPWFWFCYHIVLLNAILEGHSLFFFDYSFYMNIFVPKPLYPKNLVLFFQ